jgi:outer membrane receptor protein involved in Fe transport
MQKLKWYKLVITLLLNYLSYGQETGSITGKVIDKNNYPVEFANVFIAAQNDSAKILNATITDSTGIFLLSNIPDGEYLLHVQLIGFKKYSQAVIIDQKNRKINLSNLVIETNTTTLGGVEVTAFRNLIKKTEEGVVMNAADNLTQIGGTAADLLKNMPGVLVNADGGITLRGKSPLILINGRVSGLGGADRLANLEQIPASSIDRIEIITNPSARYDADAEGGIINIILKKNTDRGTNGAFAAGAGFGRRYRLNGTLLLNHKTEKWNVGFGYDNWYTTRTRSVNGDRIQFDVPNEYFLTQRRTDERTVKNQLARFNIDYVPDKKNSLTIEAVWLFQGEDNHETLTSTTKTAAYDFTGRNRRFSNEIRRFHTGEVTLNYKRKFNHPDQLLTVNVSSAFDYDRENTLITTQTLSQQYKDIGDPWLQKTHNYENSGVSSLAVDYVQPVSETGVIETGYKAILRILDNDFLRQNPLNGNFVTDSLNTDIYHFNEQIHAAYAQYVGWVGEKDSPKWKYHVGLRAEQVWNNSNTELKPLKFSNDYFNLYPSASLIFYTPKRNMAKLSYSRRISRPSFGQLIPFVDITDSLNQHAGNPNLKPELVHSLELSYNHSFKTGSFTTSAFYRRTGRVIMSFIALDSNGVALSQPMNFGNATAYGMEALITFNPFSFWTINLNTSAYDLRIENNGSTANIQRNQVTYFFKLINNCTLWKNGKLQLSGNYTSPIAIPQGEQVAVYFADMGFQQKIMKGQGRLGLTVTDIFNTQKSGSRTSDTNFRYSRISKVDTRAVMLTFGYTFKSTFRENLMENKFKND